MPVLLLPFIVGGAILGGGAVKGAHHACSAPSDEGAKAKIAPLRTPETVGRPLWATSTDNLDPAFVQKVFAKDERSGARFSF